MRRRDWSQGGCGEYWGCSRRTINRARGRQKAGGQEVGGSDGGTSITPVMGDGNGEGEAIGCIRFHRGRWGGGKEAPRCRRRMAQRRVARRPGTLNARLGQTAD
jgi:hypothetical protein